MLRLAGLMKEVGFPNGVVNVVPGFGEVAGERLSRSMKVTKVSFTGSTLVGRKVMQASSETNLKKVHLELGGKSPQIVFDDCDFEKTLDWVICSCFFNSSQCCTAGSRLLIQEGIYDKFVKAVAERMKTMQVGPSEKDGCYYGPLINKRQFERVLGYIKQAETEKLDLVLGGKRLHDKGYFIEPTLYTHVPDTSKLAQEEIFGPVLCAMKPFKTLEEAIERANNTTYGLAASVYTKNMNVAELFTRKIQSGTAWINCYHVVLPNVPFGGFKQSGFGRDGGYEGILEYTQVKAVYNKFDFSEYSK